MTNLEKIEFAIRTGNIGPRPHKNLEIDLYELTEDQIKYMSFPVKMVNGYPSLSIVFHHYENDLYLIPHALHGNLKHGQIVTSSLFNDKLVVGKDYLGDNKRVYMDYGITLSDLKAYKRHNCIQKIINT